ncbi:hypothetical protein AUEXF2481DRAFT_302968 [Aureobasidium subglaciale EXF-2481]|uniref:Chalcone isomerase domain-containing protein n=1 Tax=Aureobasidium subglaciale (strain EXF-2481) TaxID=1043005 RepID=A0A074Z431_AURSE|nr:uncharacterized protein AUEXF2481DRAFT_302968 [Aureobasidium subglaciale EXF-2481]KEQ93761.1 hypothetical protein AUEXF2481DRAFT_302968 [Aureobasidium subglaciale EXF-2481]
MSSSTMATPCRTAMRLLSARSRCMLQNPRLKSALPQARYSSRYSNPAARATGSTISVKAPSFLDQHQEAVDSEDAEHRPINPLDELAARREFEAKRSNAMQRMRFAAVGLLMSVAGLTLTLYNLDLDELEKGANKKKAQLDAGPGAEDFQGRHVHVIGAGDDKRIVAEGDQELDLVSTGSGSVPYFPRKIFLPVPGSETAKSETSQPNSRVNPGNVQNQEEYALVGLGIRTVTFLSIEVYVMGLYVRTQDISALQARLIHLINPNASTLVPGEKDGLKQRMLDPDTSVEIWEQLLREEGIRSAWRVVPSKNTDFAHLRDGWVNGIKRATNEITRVKQQNPAIVTADYENESFGDAMRDFKAMFSGGRTPKGSVVLMLRDAPGSMEVLFEDPAKATGIERVGKIEDPRISRLIWMGYLAGKNVSSEPTRQNVVDGFVGFAGRPVGSVETMVV